MSNGITYPCGCPPVSDCCQCGDGFLGLMLYNPCAELNPGASHLISQEVLNDFLAWAQADSDNKFIIASDGSGKYTALANFDDADGNYYGTIVKGTDETVYYIYLTQEELGTRLTWSTQSPTGSGEVCDCEPIPIEEVEDICQLPSEQEDNV